MAASVTVIGPTPGATPGTPGAFSADWKVARETPIVIEITGTVYELVAVQYPGQLDETVVYRDGAFRGSYAARSTETAISGGIRLSILPSGGWPSSDALNDITFIVDPVEGAPAPSWTLDATSGMGVPTDSEWAAVMTAAGIGSGEPNHLWLCQEAAGALADSKTGGSESLSAFNSPLYQQAIAGWTRKAVRCDDPGDAFYSTLIGNTTTESITVLAYLYTTTPAAYRNVINLGTGTGARLMRMSTAPIYDCAGNGGQATGLGVSDPSGVVRPVIVTVNRAAGRFGVYTDQEKIVPVYTVPAGGGAYFSFEGCETSRVLYAAMFRGTRAEMSEAQIKSLLQTLGWTIPWS